MSEIETTLADTADSTIRVPANLMSYIRQSYDTREKVLDWMLALGTVGAMAWFFRDEIQGFFVPDPGVNAGEPPQRQPSQNVSGAFPASERTAWLYTYNMPYSRRSRKVPGPSGTATPNDPSQVPLYPVSDS